MRKNSVFVFVVWFWLAGCAASWKNFVPVPLSELIERCHRSENCSVYDGMVSRSALSFSDAEVVRLQRLCLEKGVTIQIVEDERGLDSGLLYGQCMSQGRKLVNVTLWYFPDGRYDLTLQDCVESKCDRWFVPI